MTDNAPQQTEAAGLDTVLDRIPVLQGRPRTVADLSGGLTNRNYKVTTDRASYVVRVSTRGTDLLAIDRDEEYRNSVRAAEAGVGAPVVDFRPGDGILVVGYLPGATLTDAGVAANLDRIARSCRRLHAGRRFVNDFDMVATQARYLGIVQSSGFRLPAGYLAHAARFQAMSAALAVRAEATVPCHNDLLAANFIDDGAQIWLIDYEYAGNNEPSFELGNMWSECHLDLDQLAALITAYYGRPLRNKIARARLQGLMSKYGWTLWACIQSASSALDFDFWSWGLEKYDAAVEAFARPDFHRLLADVQRAD